jgi:GNAT superfamily N-acetyltransferase
MSVTIRVATPQDAEPVAELGREFVAYLQDLGDRHPNSLTAEAYLRDGFSENPAFAGLIAEWEDQIVGYLLYCPAYDLDLGGRILYIIDLFVREGARCRGVARALMTTAADLCRKEGGQALLWSVYSPNKMAAAFYQKLGAKYIKDLNFMYWSV